MTTGTDIDVNCSGAFFSSLQYELINNKKTQEGFLLGQIERFTSHSISDSEINNENINIVINVSGFIPCTSLGSFYSRCGRVDFAYLKQFAERNMEKIVGWYRCRRFCDKVYLQELRIHEQLRDELTHTDGHFLFALFSRINSADSGTMDASYRFQIMLNNNEFEGVPLRIVNMSDTSATQYMRSAPSASLYSSKALQTILDSIKNIEPGVKEAELLHNGLLNQLRNLLPKYATIQEQHQKALERVTKLQESCYSSQIKPAFQLSVKKECDFDLMDFDQSMKLSNKEVNGSVTEQENATSNGNVAGDPFGFVEQEMEKQQQEECPSPTKKKGLKNKKDHSLNSPKKEGELDSSPKPKTKFKATKKTAVDGESSRVKTQRGNASAQSLSTSPSRKTSRENATKVGNLTTNKSKALGGTKLNNSLAEKSPSPNSRNRSPSLGKSRLKSMNSSTESTKLSSDSQEY